MYLLYSKVFQSLEFAEITCKLSRDNQTLPSSIFKESPEFL